MKSGLEVRDASFLESAGTAGKEAFLEHLLCVRLSPLLYRYLCLVHVFVACIRSALHMYLFYLFVYMFVYI